jgi:hypothetical protein
MFLLSMKMLNACQCGCSSGCSAKPLALNPPSRYLHVGQSTTCLVSAQRLCNNTLLLVRAGENYRFKVNPPNNWSDWGKPSSADGYGSTFFQKPWEHGRVIPSANWFALCGEISQNDRFVIGSGPHDYLCRSTGPLFLFANDHPLFYWNNSGQISVSIMRKE